MAATPRRGLLLAIILTGYLLVLLDVSIVMVALPHVRDDLHFSATELYPMGGWPPSTAQAPSAGRPLDRPARVRENPASSARGSTT